jgi:hypothetical protein
MLTLWNNGRKGKTYEFTDRHISNYIRMSCPPVYIHMYLGGPDATGTPADLMKIQDVTVLENRDRKYSPDVFELPGAYNIQDVDHDLKQFGIFLSNDMFFVEFHINDMLAILGRKIISGDVLEFPHLRDDMQIDPTAKAVNRFYVVQDASKGASGYSSTWNAHIWRVKAVPMTGAQEYSDILDQQALDPFGIATGDILRNIITSASTDMAINNAVYEEAKATVSKRYFENRQFYYVPADGELDPWVFTGDGIPPDGAQLLGSGDAFPYRPDEGDYYLRTDYSPTVLYQFHGGIWCRREYDYRTSKWIAANALLESFWNNNNITTNEDGSTTNERVSLSTVIKYTPEADF